MTRATPAVAGMLDLFAEAYRLRLMRGLEEWLAGCGYCRVAGVDEAGRGSLAGPVVAAAVIADPHCSVPGVDDSKCLTAPERERLAGAIRATAVASAVVLLGAPNRILSRDQLLDLSRLHNDEVFNRSVDVQIMRLRRKIEADPAQPRYIRTERGAGYVFGVPVETVY